MKFFFLCFVFIAGEALSASFSGVDNPERARVNYILNCQGCHGPDGAGSADGDVPRMKNFLGNFLSRRFQVDLLGPTARAPAERLSVAEHDFLHFLGPASYGLAETS